MAHKSLVPKQRSLTEVENQTTFDTWRESMEFHISLDSKSARFLTDLKAWTITADRGFTDDGAEVTEDKKMTKVAKKALLTIILGSIASYAPVISPKFIKNQSTSLEDIWARLRAHYGFRKTGARITEFCEFRIESNESREALWERMYSFLEDNLLTTNGDVLHEGAKVTVDEVFTPSLMCVLVTQWLFTIHPGLPAMVRQRFPTQLRSNTIISIREEISDAIPSMLEEVQGRDTEGFVQSGTISRAGRFQGQQRFQGGRQFQKSKGCSSSMKCCLCDAAGRAATGHYIQSCPFLPPNDRKFISRTRDILVDDYEDCEDELIFQENGVASRSVSVESEKPPPASVARRIEIVPSPLLETMVNGVSTTVLLDLGAEANLAEKAVCDRVGAVIRPTRQRAMMADGVTPLNTLGETSFIVEFTHHKFVFSGLVIEKLDSGVIAGMPFLGLNDVFVRPSRSTVYIGDCCEYKYSTRPTRTRINVVTASAAVLRVPRQTCLLPGESLSFQLPSEFSEDTDVAIEPRLVSAPATAPEWLQCGVLPVKDGCVEVINPTSEPVLIGKHAQICQVRPVIEPQSIDPPPELPVFRAVESSEFLSGIKVDPSGVLSQSQQAVFHDIHHKLRHVFSPGVGQYNGHSGPFKHVINMSPNLPPQRRGSVPMYNHSDLVALQLKYDELLAEGVLARPEDYGVSIEYCHPSFLVKKSSGGFRLVTAFGEFAEFARVTPTSVSNVESVLQRIGQWNVLIKADLKWAYYQILLAIESLKYAGVISPFKGAYVYTRSVMGLPGSEAALEEVLCRVLGDLIQEGGVVKLADDLYCGAETVEELMPIWSKVLERLSANGMKLSPDKTVCCPTSTIVLGWLWENGSIRPTAHRINALKTCDPPATVSGLRSFIGSFKFMSRVLPSYSDVLSPLDDLCAGLKPSEKLVWSEQLTSAFNRAKEHLNEAKPVILPHSNDRLCIVTDAALRCAGMASGLYVVRKGKPLLAGFFNAKKRGHQSGWLPCEVEALCIAVSIKHFAPYILQSKHRVRVLTDSKACVQAYGKLCKGEFSNSARLTTFLSMVSRYHIEVVHIAGKDNLLSDFGSRNPIQCDGQCQICSFVDRAEECVVRELSVSDILSGAVRVPYATRSSWRPVQEGCPDLVKVHRYLTEGSSPGRKKKNYGDIRRYLGVASVAVSDGLLVVKHTESFKHTTERVIIPRRVSDGLLSALHIQLNHPSKHQLKLVFSRAYFALDMDAIVSRVVDGCHMCASLKHVPSRFHQQSTSPPDKVGSSFSADVLRGNGQFIMVLRESVSSFTDAMIMQDERAVTLREGLITLASRLRSPLGHHALIRTDPASSLRALVKDDRLKACNMTIELGDEKNINKNPIAEKAIAELRAELVRLQPLGGRIVPMVLAQAVSSLNSRIRHSKLSAYEIWTQREMSTGDKLSLDDSSLIDDKVDHRMKHHTSSAKSKAKGSTEVFLASCKRGDLVYIYSDRDKCRSRDKYLVVGLDKDCAIVQKLTGSQFRARRYRVKLSNIITVPTGQVNNDTHVHDTPPLAVPRNFSHGVRKLATSPGQVHISADSSDESEDEQTFSDFLPNELRGTARLDGRPRRNARPPQYLADFVDGDDLSDLSDPESVNLTDSLNLFNSSGDGSEDSESPGSDEEEGEAEHLERPRRNIERPDKYSA